RPLALDSFVQVYGKSLDTLEREWLTEIEQTEYTQKERDFVQLMIATKEGSDVYLSFGAEYPEYATYPARAEEIMCLLWDTLGSDREKAFSYANQYNEVMKAWKQGIETFEEALKGKDLQKKPELFEKAASFYEVAGDEDMVVRARAYAAGCTSLAMAQTYLEQKCVLAAENELEKAKILLEGSGAEREEIQILDEYLTELKEQNIEVLNTGVVLIGIVVIGVVLLLQKVL
ncbi:MAG: hypothetical protein HXS40_12515, partial [Theionarchaea archaeon]|nr:hypothetical protein [Theionarchaea archaeon]